PGAVPWRRMLRALLACGGLLAAGTACSSGCQQLPWESIPSLPGGTPCPNPRAAVAGRMFVVGCSLGRRCISVPVAGRGVPRPRRALPQDGAEKVLLTSWWASPSLGAWYFVGTWHRSRLERVAGAQILNFLFVPPAYRVFYVNVVTLGWDTYLSYLNTG
uniref:MPV17 mitochondrial inner membrane protein like 2 n=1 Tax=Taeniopygia guttata TaxID=59729 RepID=A0A674H8C1_TAEGU